VVVSGLFFIVLIVIIYHKKCPLSRGFFDCE
jgi:hypothetical protein